MINYKYIFCVSLVTSLLYLLGTSFDYNFKEHYYRIDSNHNELNCIVDCKDSKVKKHKYKAVNLSSSFDFSFVQSYQISDNYLARDSFSLGLVAYQSRAP